MSTALLELDTPVGPVKEFPPRLPVTSRTLQRLDEKQLRLGWIMRDFAPGIQAIERGQIPAAPLQIEVHPYYGGQPAACNYRCAWCTRLEDKLALKSDGIVGIAPDRLIAFIASLKDTGVRRLVLSGNSTEPLLYPRIGEVLQTIHASGMSWVLYTNFRYGANIIDAAVDYARRGDLLRVSLDAGNERSYLRTHRPRNDTRAFQAVIANLEKLLAVRALRKSPLTVGVAYLMTEVNSGEEELREAIERGMSMGVDFMRFSVPLKPTHQNPHFALAEAEARRIRSRISRLALEYLGRPDWTGDCPNLYVRQDDVVQGAKPFGGCHHGKLVPVIGARGKVYPCTSTSTADFDHLGIGNINDPDFPAEFWRIWRDPAKWRHNVQCCPDCTRFEYDVNVEIDQRLAKLRGQGGLPEERERAQATKAIEKRGGTAAEEVL